MTFAIVALITISVGLLSLALCVAYAVGVHDGRILEQEEQAQSLQRRDRLFTTTSFPRVLR